MGLRRSQTGQILTKEGFDGVDGVKSQ